jgi:hypothetical protein
VNAQAREPEIPRHLKERKMPRLEPKRKKLKKKKSRRNT